MTVRPSSWVSGGVRVGSAAVLGALALAACTDTAEDPVGSADGDVATIQAFPDPSPSAADRSARSSPPSSPQVTRSPAGPRREALVTFAQAGTRGAADEDVIRRGGVPDVLAAADETAGGLGGASEQVSISTVLECPARRVRTREVPLRQDGLLRLRASAQVVADLAVATTRPGSRGVSVLALSSDRAVVLVLGERSRILARASAQQIDERWFVGEVETCGAAGSVTR